MLKLLMKHPLIFQGQPELLVTLTVGDTAILGVSTILSAIPRMPSMAAVLGLRSGVSIILGTARIVEALLVTPTLRDIVVLKVSSPLGTARIVEALLVTPTLRDIVVLKVSS